MSKKKEKELGYDDGSYLLPKRRKFSIFAFILCLLVAIVIWLYATNKQLLVKEGDTPQTDSLYSETAVDVPSASSL